MTEPVDHLMAIMEASFEPRFREAWTRRQVTDSLAMPSTFMMLTNETGAPAREGDTAAGFVLARQAADEVELLLIAVRPEYRRTGLATCMLDAFFEKSRELGAARVFLEVRADNAARALYRRAGFEQIGQRPRYYRTTDGEHIDAITYGKTLSEYRE